VMDLTKQILSIRKSRDFQSKLETSSEIGEVSLLIESFNTLMCDIRKRDETTRQLAYFDSLTGLPNRMAMQEYLSQLPARVGGAKGAIVSFDLRRFRSLNEAFGQATGDALLRLAADRFEAGNADGYLARLGGHEFAVHYSEVKDKAEAASRAQDIRALFARPLPIGQSGVKIDVDAGIFMQGDNEDELLDADTQLQCAGLALKQARQGGMAGIAFFTSNMRERVRTESELGQDLRAAISDGGLDVQYQCIYDLRGGTISGFEALARWCHPKLGYVSPSVFIPVAEANGLIADLGRWVLNESCRQAVQWQRQTGKRRTVSVNVSAAQFLEAGFTEEVEACLKRHGLPPELLCLELTESVFIGASASAIRECLYVLSSLGIKLALDDFGTGYSSLGYLARLPFTTIKIDRAFVANAEATPRRKALLKSIIDMSHSVGMDVVAEGAETRTELQLLTELGAERVQGYVIARPMPAAEAYVAAQAAENAIFSPANMERVA
jgi:diguanylate cyclase (GGDEF)-like protein